MSVSENDNRKVTVQNCLIISYLYSINYIKPNMKSEVLYSLYCADQRVLNSYIEKAVL